MHKHCIFYFLRCVCESTHTNFPFISSFFSGVFCMTENCVLFSLSIIVYYSPVVSFTCQLDCFFLSNAGCTWCDFCCCRTSQAFFFLFHWDKLCGNCFYGCSLHLVRGITSQAEILEMFKHVKTNKQNNNKTFRDLARFCPVYMLSPMRFPLAHND